MMRVSVADTTPKYASPHIAVACAPTPAAPTILAMVLKDSMDDKGRSMFSFNFFSDLARLFPLISKVLTNETDTDSKVDSAIEQRKEIESAKKKYVRRRVN